MAYFLLEIGSEEIPDWMIEPALEDLRAKFQAAFGAFGGSALVTEATPRRLVLLAKDLNEKAPDTESVVPGPYLSAGIKAAEGFARKCGTEVNRLGTMPDAKGERYVFHQLTKGQSLAAALSEKLPEIIVGIHFPKSMYWTGKGGVRFIRPIRWILTLLDDQVIPLEVAGVKSGNTTRGHRILGSKHPIPVTLENYDEQVLPENFVIVHAEERKRRIEAALGPDVRKDPDLLRTLVYLTEFPTPIRGSFDPSYLELPEEILTTVMRHHQRYFSVLKEDGSLAPEFVAVTNTNGDPDGLIRQGNERVLRARFNDARFFWQVDQQKKLSARLPDLAKITFQAKLGSYKDKTERVVKLASILAAQTGADANVVEVAALLSKCDLTTDMVKEFTELQGIVGGLYAKAQGEGEAVATAIYDHYKPASMDDSIPRTLEGQIVSIADKLDTLRECFKIGLVPTGSKDPFALRRAAQGIVKIVFEARLELELPALIEDVPQLAAFIRERMQFYLRDVLGFAYDEVNAALAAPLTTAPDLADRVDAIHFIRPTGNFEPLAASFKRIKNILTQAGVETVSEPDPKLLAPGPERTLYDAFLRVREATKRNSSNRENLASIASLRPDVDLFFDKILVNDPDPAIRQNRLGLLSSLLAEFSTIADFSEIVTS
ncbi:MAG TPA: glycine--tRNA ligase subunit beta [Bryobacteraceae bacterium]|jgi:glycyl-tRNA synthetase beta chain